MLPLRCQRVRLLLIRSDLPPSCFTHARPPHPSPSEMVAAGFTPVPAACNGNGLVPATLAPLGHTTG